MALGGAIVVGYGLYFAEAEVAEAVIDDIVIEEVQIFPEEEAGEAPDGTRLYEFTTETYVTTIFESDEIPDRVTYEFWMKKVADGDGWLLFQGFPGYFD